LAVGVASVPPWSRILLLATGVTLAALISYRQDHYLLAVLLGALVVRLIVIVVDVQFSVLKHPPIMPGHHQRSLTQYHGILNGNLFGNLPHTDDKRRLLAMLLTPFYAIFGEWSLSGRIGIATYSLGIGAAIYGIASRLTSRKVALGTTAITLVWPSILYRSTLIQREVLVAVVMLAFVWLGVRWADSIRLWELLLLPVLVETMMILRKENFFVVFVIFGTVLLARSEHARRNLVIAGVVSVPALAVLAANFGTITGFGTVLAPETIDAFAQGRAHGETAYLVSLRYESWLDVVVYLPVKVAYYLFAPFPWQWSSLQTTLVGVNGLLLFGATVAAVRSIGFSWRRSFSNLVPVAFLLAGITAYAIIELNYGAAFRRRIQFTPVILMFAAIRLSYMNLSLWWQSRDRSQVTDDSDAIETAGGSDD
jgi:hypothetical protein